MTNALAGLLANLKRGVVRPTTLVYVQTTFVPAATAADPAACVRVRPTNVVGVPMFNFLASAGPKKAPVSVP